MAITDVNDYHFQLLTEDPMDLERLQKICIDTFQETFGDDNSQEQLDQFYHDHYSIDRLKEELDSDESQTFLYNLRGRIAGYLKVNWGSAQTESDYPDALEIQRLYLLKRYQKLHIGGRLMKKALSIAKDQKKSAVWLGVWENNTNAQGFYDHYGFKRVGQHDFIVGNDRQTDYIMLKKLK